MKTLPATRTWFLSGSVRASLSLAIGLLQLAGVSMTSGCAGGPAHESAATAQASTTAKKAPSVVGKMYSGAALTTILFGRDGTYTTSSEGGSSSGSYTQNGATVFLFQSDGGDAEWQLEVSEDGKSLSRDGDVWYTLIDAPVAPDVAGYTYSGPALSTIELGRDGTYTTASEGGSSSGTYTQNGATLFLVQSDGAEWQLAVSEDGKTLSRDGDVLYTRP